MRVGLAEACRKTAQVEDERRNSDDRVQYKAVLRSGWITALFDFSSATQKIDTNGDGTLKEPRWTGEARHEDVGGGKPCPWGCGYSLVNP